VFGDGQRVLADGVEASGKQVQEQVRQHPSVRLHPCAAGAAPQGPVFRLHQRQLPVRPRGNAEAALHCRAGPYPGHAPGFLADDVGEQRVGVRHGDQLRGEGPCQMPEVLAKQQRNRPAADAGFFRLSEDADGLPRFCGPPDDDEQRQGSPPADAVPLHVVARPRRSGEHGGHDEHASQGQRDPGGRRRANGRAAPPASAAQAR